MAYFEFESNSIYYEIIGNGLPLLMLHGNTVSSKIFDPVIDLYTKDYKVVKLDFPGHGKSSRVDKFDSNFWYYNSKVCHALLDKLKLNTVSAIGISGGALVAINLGLEHPERVNYIFADSFIGEYPSISYTNSLKKDREKDKNNTSSRNFWQMHHGSDWQSLIDLDTEMQIDFSKHKKSYFHKSISRLSVPALLTGSTKDEFCHNLDVLYENIRKKNQNISIHMFTSGSHPAFISNKYEYYQLVKNII